MSRPADVKFLKSHEWARKDGGLVVVGISDFAVEQMNREITYVELPAAGRTVKRGDNLAVVESTKAASDVYAPISGTVVESNASAAADVTLVCDAPFEGGWLVKIRPSDPAEWDQLLSPDDYEKHCETEGEH